MPAVDNRGDPDLLVHTGRVGIAVHRHDGGHLARENGVGIRQLLPGIRQIAANLLGAGYSRGLLLLDGGQIGEETAWAVVADDSAD